jgi:hypothetical protein
MAKNLILLFEPKGFRGEFNSRLAVANHLSELADAEIVCLKAEALSKKLTDKITNSGQVFLIAGNDERNIAHQLKRKNPNKYYYVFMPYADRPLKGPKPPCDLFVQYDHLPLVPPGVTSRYFSSVPTAISLGGILEEGKKWDNRFAVAKLPTVALMLGGNIKGKTEYKPEHAQQIAYNLKPFLQANPNHRLVIINSPRTPDDFMAAIKNAFPKAKIYDFKTIKQNPYKGILAAADLVIAPPDSMSMQADAAALWKKFYIWNGDDLTLPHHDRHIEGLINAGAAAWLESLPAKTFEGAQSVLPTYNPHIDQDIMPSQTALKIATAAFKLSYVFENSGLSVASAAIAK